MASQIKIPRKHKKLSVQKQVIATLLDKELKFKGKKVLEIGCGDWDIIKNKVEKNNEWFGLDIAPSSIANCLGTIDKIPFPDKTFDIVIANQVLEHIFEYGISFKKALKEINRVLKLEGEVIFTVPIHNHGHPMFLFGEEEEIFNTIQDYFEITYMEGYYAEKVKGWQQLSNKGFFNHIGYPNVFFNNDAFTYQMLIKATKWECDIERYYKYKFRKLKVFLRFIKAMVV